MYIFLSIMMKTKTKYGNEYGDMNMNATDDGNGDDVRIKWE